MESQPGESPIAEEIIDGEQAHTWSLMHRYNLCLQILSK